MLGKKSRSPMLLGKCSIIELHLSPALSFVQQEVRKRFFGKDARKK
jgi:hypothetical protein